MSNKAPIELSDMHIAILRVLLEYRYLTCRGLWQALEARNRDATSMAHKMRQMSAWGLVQGETLDLQRGGGNPKVYSLLQAGGVAIGERIGSQYYRRPTLETVWYQDLRLRAETALSNAGYDYIRPISFNSSNPKPNITVQSARIIWMLRVSETQSINRALQQHKRSWYARRWENRADYSDIPVLNADTESDPDVRDWIETMAASELLAREHRERIWRQGKIHPWLWSQGLLDPTDISDKVINRMLKVTSGDLNRPVPQQLNDYIAWCKAEPKGQITDVESGADAVGAGDVTPQSRMVYSDMVYSPLVMVLYRDDRDRRYLLNVLDQYQPILAQVEPVLLFGESLKEQLAYRELDKLAQRREQAQLRGFRCLSIAEWPLYLARRLPVLM